METSERGRRSGDFPPNEAEEPVGADAEAEMQGPPLRDRRGVGRRCRRLLRNSLTLTLLALLCALLLTLALSTLLSFPDTLRTVLHLPPPTPTATLLPGADSIIWTHSVPWGTLTIDGRAISGQQVGDSQTFHTLPSGRHLIAYRATHFPVLRCQLSVPAHPRDTCPVAPHGDDPTSFTGRTREVDLRATPERLPPEQQRALLAAIDAVLAVTQTTVPVAPGDHYQGTAGMVQTAAEALTATLWSTRREELCRFCDADIAAGATAPAAGPAWRIQLFLQPHWRYTTTASGHVVAENAPSTPPGGPSDEATLFAPVHVRWEGTWQVTVPWEATGPPASTLCTALLMQLYDRLAARPGFASANWRETVEATLPGISCVLSLRRYTEQGLPAAAPARFLLRLGLLLALDAQAHSLAPDLPQANAHEQALAPPAAPAGGQP